VRVVERGQRPYAHEFLGADFDDGHTNVVVEMGNDCVAHGYTIAGSPKNS
jgi:hypothetical protein